MSAIISGLIGGLIAAGLGALALRSQKSATLDKQGWSRLRPGLYVHFTLIGCLTLVAVTTVFFYIGGSARADAVQQNFMALLVMTAFAVGAAWTLWYGYLRKVEWKEDYVRVTFPSGRVVQYRFADFAAAAESMDGFQVRLRTYDGRTLRVSKYSHGFRDFMNELAERSPLIGED